MKAAQFLCLACFGLVLLAGCTSAPDTKSEKEPPAAASPESGATEDPPAEKASAPEQRSDKGGDSETSSKTATASKTEAGAPEKQKAAAVQNPVNEAYSQAKALAQKEGKLILLKFSADWCPPCQEMSKAMKNDLLFVEELKHYKVVEVDFDDEDSKDLKEKFYPEGGIPFVMVLRPEDESRVVDQTGFDTALQMVKLLKSAREKA